MAKLIRFVTDATGAMLTLLAAIGFIALLCGIGVILYKDFKDFTDAKTDGERKDNDKA